MRLEPLWACVLAVAICLPAMAARDCSVERPIAFVSVTLIRPEIDQALPNQTVMVRCDRIEAVGPADEVRPPSGSIVINGRDRFLSPGLVDAHMHLEEDRSDLLQWLAAGVTSVRSMDGVPAHVAWREHIKAGEWDGPTIYTTGPILYGWEEEWRTDPDPKKVARRIVAENNRIGYDYLKVYYHLSTEQYDALVEAAAESRLPVVGHVPRAVGLEHVLLSGQRSIEHLTGYDDALERKDHHITGIGSAWLEMRRTQNADEAAIPAITQRTAKTRTWNVPTLLDYEVWTRPDEISALLADTSTLDLLSEHTRKDWASYNKYQISRLEEQTPEDRETLRQAARIRREIFKALFDAGALLAAGTDSPGAHFLVPGDSLHEELGI